MSADLMTVAVGPITPVYPTAMVGCDVLAVPDFVAGLIYGFTGDNDLAELEACYQGGKQV